MSVEVSVVHVSSGDVVGDDGVGGEAGLAGQAPARLKGIRPRSPRQDLPEVPDCALGAALRVVHPVCRLSESDDCLRYHQQRAMDDMQPRWRERGSFRFLCDNQRNRAASADDFCKGRKERARRSKE